MPDRTGRAAEKKLKFTSLRYKERSLKPVFGPMIEEMCPSTVYLSPARSLLNASFRKFLNAFLQRPI